MADGMREKTTNVGGVIKRIWYAMTGATQGAQLLSLDDAGNLEGKLLNPVINGTVTGTAVTTTGENGKIVKTVGDGRIDMAQSVNGSLGLVLTNTSTGVNANTGLSTKADNDAYLTMWNYGSGRTATILGETVGNYGALFSQGTNSKGLLLGTLNTGSKVIIGVEGIPKLKIDSSNAIWSVPITSTQYKLSALNTAPSSATATGTLGEIRIDTNYIYVCVATNTWKRTALTTW